MRTFILAFSMIVVAAKAQQTRLPEAIPGPLPLASGTLVAADSEAISFRQNDKVTRVLLTPATEIWRRGIDFAKPSDLVPGEQLVLRYAEKRRDGVMVAEVVAMPSPGDSVVIEAHRIVASHFTEGILAAADMKTIQVRNNEGTVSLRLTPETRFWRGEESHDPGVLQVGDEVVVNSTVDYASGEYVANSVEANIRKVSGKISRIEPDGIEVIDEDEQGQPLDRVKVVFDDRTKFLEGSPSDLTVGAMFETIGLGLDQGRVRATTVFDLKPVN